MDGTAPREPTPFGAFLRKVGDELAQANRGRVPSTPPPDPTWRRLLTETTPIPGESLRGLVARACHRNDLPNSWGLLQHLGLPHRNKVLVSEEPNIDPAELAYAMRVETGEVEMRRYAALGRRHVDFFGLDLDAHRIATTVRRFSPVALAKSAHHRAAWELEDLPFCLDGWDMLQDRCGCEPRGLVQRWTRTATAVDECDNCGDPLGEMEPFPVPAHMQTALEILEPVVDPRPEHRIATLARLPKQLRQQDRTLIFDLIVLIADNVDPRGRERPIDEPERRLHGLHEACAALASWPNGLDAVTFDADAPKSAIGRIRTKWRNLASPGGQAGFARRGSARTPRVPGAPRAKRPYVRVTRSPLVGIRQATEIAKLSPEVLKAAWELGFLTKHSRMHGDRSLPAFDPAELAAFGQEWRARVEPRTFAAALGISTHGIEQMAEIGVVKPDARSLPGSGPHFLPGTVNAFMAQFERQGSADGPAPVIDGTTIRLVDAMMLIGGRAKPWGPIMKALMDGRLPFRLRQGRLPIERVVIGTEQIGLVLSATFSRAAGADRYSDRMVQSDALELLNVGPTGARLLDGLESTGVNPKFYAVSDVERRAAMIASLPELAAHAGRDPATTQQRLAKLRRADPLRFAEIIPGGWPRDLVPTIREAIDELDNGTER